MTNVSVFDWTIYRNMFSSADMELVFSEENTIRCWVDVEKAVATAQAAVGIIPTEYAEEINQKISFEALDLAQLQTSTRVVGRPIAGFVDQIKDQVSTEAKQWVHFGITTYDTMDTGRALQIRQGLALIETTLTLFRSELVNLATIHRTTLMIGRTNNLHAQPKTFGAKLAVWIEESMRHQDRLDELKKRVLVIQFGGAVGSLASLGDKGLEFRREVSRALGLGTVLSNWHNARDGITECAQTLGLICASLARIGQGISVMESTEIGELTETGEAGRGRSTTMAHKANPRAAEFTEAVARLGRHRSTGLIEIMGQDHDRSGGTWIAEWALLPEVFLLTSGALSWANDLLARLQVNVDQMRKNVDITNGLAMTECFTHALAKRMQKSQARALLDEACGIVRKTGMPLPEVLKSMAQVQAAIEPQEIDKMAAPENYVGIGPEILDNVLDAAKEYNR